MTASTPTSTRCSASTLAKLLGLTERRIQQLAQAGHVVKGARGEYELIGSIREYIAYCEAKALPKAESSLAMARQKLMEVQIEKTQLEVHILRKDWVAQREVDAYMDDMTQRYIQGLESLPGRLAMELMHQSDPAAIRQILQNECRQLRRDLAKHFAQRGNAHEKPADVVYLISRR